MKLAHITLLTELNGHNGVSSTACGIHVGRSDGTVKGPLHQVSVVTTACADNLLHASFDFFKVCNRH